MSISHSLSNALSGMTAASRMAEVVSSNLANSLTDGYGRRSLDLSSSVIGGRGSGVNIDGMFFLCRAALRHMTTAGSGVIVNFGSIWGGVGSVGSTAYCVSKGAVHQLTRALALDHAEQGIRVNAVAPGEVNTPMLSSQRDIAPSAEDLQALADATIPMKRLAEPEEIAKVVVFLASDDASYMTGQIVHVDAGYTAR